MKYNEELNHAWSRLKLFSDKKFFITKEVFKKNFMLPVRFLQVYGCPQECWMKMADIKSSRNCSPTFPRGILGDCLLSVEISWTALL